MELSERLVNELMNLHNLTEQLVAKHMKLSDINSNFKGAELQQLFDQTAKALTGFITDKEHIKIIKKYCSKQYAMPALPVMLP